MNDFESVVDDFYADDFYADAPPYCNGCGHFHEGDCIDPNADCGSFLCCNGLGDND